MMFSKAVMMLYSCVFLLSNTTTNALTIKSVVDPPKNKLRQKMDRQYQRLTKVSSFKLKAGFAATLLIGYAIKREMKGIRQAKPKDQRFTSRVAKGLKKFASNPLRRSRQKKELDFEQQQIDAGKLKQWQIELRDPHASKSAPLDYFGVIGAVVDETLAILEPFFLTLLVPLFDKVCGAAWSAGKQLSAAAVTLVLFIIMFQFTLLISQFNILR